MKYKFDEIIDRSRTNSFKWKARELKNNGHEMYPCGWRIWNLMPLRQFKNVWPTE